MNILQYLNQKCKIFIFSQQNIFCIVLQNLGAVLPCEHARNTRSGPEAISLGIFLYLNNICEFGLTYNLHTFPDLRVVLIYQRNVSLNSNSPFNQSKIELKDLFYERAFFPRLKFPIIFLR